MKDEEYMNWRQREEDKWNGYEAEKNKLKRLNLSSEEYDKRIAEIIRRLKL